MQPKRPRVLYLGLYWLSPALLHLAVSCFRFPNLTGGPDLGRGMSIALSTQAIVLQLRIRRSRSTSNKLEAARNQNQLVMQVLERCALQVS